MRPRLEQSILLDRLLVVIILWPEGAIGAKVLLEKQRWHAVILRDTLGVTLSFSLGFGLVQIVDCRSVHGRLTLLLPLQRKVIEL